MKLLKLLEKKPFCNDFHFIFIGVILLILSFKYYFFFIFLTIYLIFILRKTNLLIPISIFLFIFMIIIFSKIIINNTNKKDNYKGIITDVCEKYYVLNTGLCNIKCYEKDHNYTPGDIIEIKINLYDDKKSYDADYDLNENLLSNNLSYSGRVSESKKTGRFIAIKSLKYYYLSYLKKHLSTDTYSYISSIIFAENELDDDILDSYSSLGISHILSISGMHIMILYYILSFIMLHLFKNYHKTIPLFIVSLYVIFFGFKLSSLRALLFLLISNLNRGRIKYSRLDILSLSGIIILLINPYYLFSLGFILSFLVSFILLFGNDLFKYKGFIDKSYKRYLMIFLITLPFTIKLNNKISLLSIILSPILSLAISYIIIPLSFLISVIPFLDFIFKYVYTFLNLYVSNLASYTIDINIKTFNIYYMISYYVLFIFLIYSIASKKYKLISIISLDVFMLFIIFEAYLNFIPKVTFIDVGQGDSSLIVLPHNEGNILIDAYNSYNYLKSEGINKIDYLILTHSDSDHIGDYKEIIKNIKVKYILYPYYDERFEDLLKDYNNKIMVDYNYQININNYLFDILGPINSYDDPNSNSIVIKAYINNYTFLFTGDMTENEENDLINNYSSYLNSDILKVAHHGSSSSSTALFLNIVSPDISIISVGKNNKYNLPKEEVVEKLNKISKVYMTKDSGNISIKIYNNRYHISTYR